MDLDLVEEEAGIPTHSRFATSGAQVVLPLVLNTWRWGFVAFLSGPVLNVTAVNLLSSARTPQVTAPKTRTPKPS